MFKYTTQKTCKVNIKFRSLCLIALNTAWGHEVQRKLVQAKLSDEIAIYCPGGILKYMQTQQDMEKYYKDYTDNPP